MQPGESFGRVLKERRRTLDITQEGLARQVGCAVITIKKIEGDTLRPSRQIAELLAEALEIPADQRAAFVRLARSTVPTDRSPSPRTPTLSPQVGESADLSGRFIKGYELRERIGVGGFGAVYRAQQVGVGRSVAIKIILPQYANHPKFIRRFESEAQIVARLEHPHIVPLYDYWREPDGAYLVMRYISGRNLQTALQGIPWPIDRVTRLLDQIGSALAFAHQLGVVHRDIKPANILLDSDGNAYLADFGIAEDLRTAESDDVTQEGTIVGSPAYLSPEQIRDEPVTPQTDIYSLGILLYEMLSGAPPFPKLPPGELLQKQLYEPLPELAAHRADLPAQLTDVIQRATAKQMGERYSDVHSLTLAFRQALLNRNASMIEPAVAEQANSVTHGAHEHAAAIAAPDQETAFLSAMLDADMLSLENPYKGLRAFSEADAGHFFGRTALTQQLLARLTEETDLVRFLAVVGPSGSGKSSVVKAGLIPAIRRGGLPGSERWFVVEILPGAHPLEEIEAALLRVAVNPPTSLLDQLQENERGLLRAVKRVLPADDTTELVLVIDQFEEIFTVVEDEAARTHLLSSIVAAVSDPRSRVWVIVTLRTDFYDRPLMYAGIGDMIRERTEVVLPLTPTELEQAIVGPAQQAGLRIEPGLVAAIAKDVGEQPGTLPLLQYALTELFERRQGRTLTLAAYQSTGGVMSALARRVDELYDRFDAVGQEVTRQIFLRLVALGEGVEDTRRRVRLDELAGGGVATNAVIEAFGRYRLLTFDRDPISRTPTIEVAHEALIRHWGRLRGWLDTSRDTLRVQRRLMAAASEWKAGGHDPSFLASGARLAQFEELAIGADLALNATERAYLCDSVAERERQEAAEQARQDRELELARQSAAAQRSAAKRLRYLVGALALFLVVAIGLSVFALNSRAAAITNLNRSEAQRLAAEANRLILERQSSELAALLAVRSMQLQYTPQGDEALAGAAQLDLPIRRFSGHTALVGAVAVSPNGAYILTGSYDGTARLWDLRAGAEIRKLICAPEVSNVAFSPDGAYFLIGCVDGIARLVETETGREIRAFRGHTAAIWAVAIAPNGRTMLTGSKDKTARLWDIQTGALLETFSKHPGDVWSVAYTSDGQTIISGSTDNIARVWDIRTGSLIRTLAHDTSNIEHVMFTPDTRFILTTSSRIVHLWDFASGAEVRRFIGHTENIRALALSHNGRFILSGSEDGTARLWDIQTGEELHRFNGKQSNVLGVAISPDDRFLVTAGLDGTALLWDLQQPGKPPTLHHEAAASGAVFSPDGTMILTGSDDKTARLWDVQTGREIKRFVHPEAVQAVAFAPDGRSIVTTSLADNIVRQWDIASGMLMREYTSDQILVKDITFSHNGNLLLTGDSHAARLWDTRTGSLIGKMGPVTDVFSVALSERWAAVQCYLTHRPGRKSADLSRWPESRVLHSHPITHRFSWANSMAQYDCGMLQPED